MMGPRLWELTSKDLLPDFGYPYLCERQMYTPPHVKKILQSDNFVCASDCIFRINQVLSVSIIIGEKWGK